MQYWRDAQAGRQSPAWQEEWAMHDLVIRGAIVVDGLGHDPVRADVAVKDGHIAAIGELGTDAAETVDAGASR